MQVLSFVEKKAKQLCYYLRAFWRGELPHAELDLFFWDTMEEWGLLEPAIDANYSQRERVFWHLLHQVHFWPEEDLRQNLLLKEELHDCLYYLEGTGVCPQDCVGIRP